MGHPLIAQFVHFNVKPVILILQIVLYAEGIEDN